MRSQNHGFLQQESFGRSGGFSARQGHWTNRPRPASFNVYEKRVTLSGFSSGGTFAQMYQISHSSTIHGIAVFSHTYYRCGPPSGKIDDYDKVCTKLFNQTGDKLYNPELVHKDIETYLYRGLIDDPVNLRHRFLYVYTGLRNFLFTADQSLSILQVYERYIKNPHRIKTRVQDAELLLPTNNEFGVPCTERPDNTSFIGNCGFSGPYEALVFLHGSDHRMRETTGASKQSLMQQLKMFDQREFVTGLKNPQLDMVGYYFVPTTCERRRCLLHIYFHGCLTGRQFEGTKHIEQSGFLEIAEASDMILIFPQAVMSEPQNDIGCWDTFGISGELYATKRGDQITAVKRMVDRALGKGTLSSSSSSSGQIWFNNKQDATSFAQEGQKGGWSHHNQYGGGGRGKQKYRAGYGHYYG
ncbi:uncharacterized protein LOC110859407 isoform X2 [Folsomia candida]|uniref:uncharacterized protein LOC110859407 isoform X2 n=1 Tax=Folsomia candida TaxID=158441 RepID=UPI001604A660|nr:uncharacterized protein LOC110859407 isoform X2 [Folsomia candida]